MHYLLSRILLWMLQVTAGLFVGATITMFGVIFLGKYAIVVVVAIVVLAIVAYSYVD